MPAFYERDPAGIPRAWLARIRRSMAVLSPRFSATRMLRDYLDQAYLPAAAALRRRLADGAAAARSLCAWEHRLRRGWKSLHIGTPDMIAEADGWACHVPVYLGEIRAEDVRVEIFADPTATAPGVALALDRGAPVPGAVNGFTYSGRVATARPRTDFTVRILPAHPEARVPAELPLIRWQE
ncbi:MAG: hypothetical protein ACP5NP_14725 [Acetobacteraceae bacterium]